MIICGAGPSGCTAALALADSDLKIAVIEKNTFPRDKVCGDAIAAYVPNVLATIDPDLKNMVGAFQEKVLVNTCRIVAPNQKVIDLTFGETGFISKRIHWDNFLYETASKKDNVRFFLSHLVTDIVIDRKHGRVEVTSGNFIFRSKIIIGCDGAQSMVNKKITGTKPDLNHYSGAVRAYYRNVTDIPCDTFELHFLKELLPGYFWIFPVGENIANVGVGILSSEISKRKVDLKSALQHAIERNPYVARRFEHASRIGKIEGFGLPLGSRKIPISGDHFMLCGDAAALIDPLSGEGIGQAIVSGRYAGWHAKKCFERNDFSEVFMKQYDKQVYDKFWNTHKKKYLLQKLIGDRDWVINGAFNFAKRNKWFQDIMERSLV